MLFQVSKSERIAVIGGGAAGLELVGELATDYPSKKVVLLHSREQILDDRMAPKFLKKINDGLKALKVETFLGEKVNMDDLNVSLKIMTVSIDIKPRLDNVSSVFLPYSPQSQCLFHVVYPNSVFQLLP